MQDVSLVLAPYGRIGRAIGVVGVLGPTRMPYAQAIASVDFVSGLMNELVEHLYADRPTSSRAHHRGAAETGRPASREPVCGSLSSELTAEELQAQLEAAKTLAAEHLASLQRTAADFANFKRRTAEDRERDLGLASESVLRKLLAWPTISTARSTPCRRSSRGGLDRGHRAARSKAAALLESEGVTRSR